MARAKNTIETQLEKANAILTQLNPNITAQDRVDAQKELELSEPTVKRYLIGQAKEIDTAIRMINFLRGRIKQRDEALKTVA